MATKHILEHLSDAEIEFFSYENPAKDYIKIIIGNVTFELSNPRLTEEEFKKLMSTKATKKTRQYPRFLFSNPQNTKSKGPFIIHLLEPNVMFKLVVCEPDSTLPRKSYKLEKLSWGADVSDEIVESIKKDAWNWLAPQLKEFGFS